MAEQQVEVVVVIRSPFEAGRHAEAWRMAVGLGLVKNHVTVIAAEDGVWGLAPALPGGASTAIFDKHQSMILALGHRIVVEAESLRGRGVMALRQLGPLADSAALHEPFEVRSREECVRLISEARHVVVW